MVLESKIQADFITLAKSKGLLAFKIEVVGRRGCPDLLIVIPGGRVIFVEVKTPRGRVSKLQKSFIRMLRLFGVPAYVCHVFGAI